MSSKSEDNVTPLSRFSSERLVKARGERRREEIAVAAGVSVDTIRSWEIGETEPTASRLAAIAHLTQHPIDFFFEQSAA